MWKPEVMSLAQPPAAAAARMSAEEGVYTRAAPTAASPLQQPLVPIGQQRRNNIPPMVSAKATGCVAGSANMVTSTYSQLFSDSWGIDATYSSVAAAAAAPAVPTATARGVVATSEVPWNILSRMAAAATAARSVSAAGTSATVTCPAAPALPNKIFDPDGSAAARPSLQTAPFKDSEKEKSTQKEAGKENYYSTSLQLEDEIYAIAREVRDPEFPTFSLGDLGVVTPELVCVTKQPSPLTWPTHRGRCSQRLSSSNRDTQAVNSDQSNSTNRDSSNSWEITVATGHASSSSSRSTSPTRKASSSRNAYNGGSHRRHSVTSSNATDGECPSSTRASSTIRSSRRCSTSSSLPMQQRREKQLSKVHAPTKAHVRVGHSRRTNGEMAGASCNNSKKHSSKFCVLDSSSTATENPVCEASGGSSIVDDESPAKRQTGHCNTSSRTSRSLFMSSRDSSTDESESNSEGEEGRESDDSAATVATVGLKPTNARCSLASLIGLAVRCKLEQHFVSDSPLLTLWQQQGQGQHAEEGSPRAVPQGEQHQRRAGLTPTQRSAAEQQRERGETEDLVVAVEAPAGATGRDDGLQGKRVQQCSDICDYGRGKGRRRRLHFNIEVVEHEDAAALTKQLNDKERCFAALEGNPAVAELVWAAVEEDRPDA